MLTEEEQREIAAEFPHYAQKRAVCIDALKIVQRHRRWVCDEDLRDLARFLEMTPDELDSEATFYNLIFRRPVGQHVIFLCNSASCWVMGSDQVRERLTARLGIQMGETTPDEVFTLLPIACLGACDHAPALMIDGDLQHDVNVDQIDDVLMKYRQGDLSPQR
jgi:NADH-quinone oxidoreductase subunit E